MKMLNVMLLVLLPRAIGAQETAPNQNNNNAKAADGALVSSIAEGDLAGFDHYAPQVRELVRSALALTRMNLTYTFGSADPRQGGMDCSGTVYRVLQDFGIKETPRQSDEMAMWVQRRTLLHRVGSADSLAHPEFAALRPGDLLFWSGTYDAKPRKLPVTHVMLYLGKLKKSGRHVVFGASDGRAYEGQKRRGVSVFDLTLPRPGGSASIYGYGLIPGIGTIAVKETVRSVESKVPAAADPETKLQESAASSKTNKTGANDKDTSTRQEEVRRAVVPMKKAAPKPVPTKSPDARKPSANPSSKIEEAAERLVDSLRRALRR